DEQHTVVCGKSLRDVMAIHLACHVPPRRCDHHDVTITEHQLASGASYMIAASNAERTPVRLMMTSCGAIDRWGMPVQAANRSMMRSPARPSQSCGTLASDLSLESTLSAVRQMRCVSVPTR